MALTVACPTGSIFTEKLHLQMLFYLPPGIQKTIYMALHIDKTVFQVITLDGKLTIDTLNILTLEKQLTGQHTIPSLTISQTCCK